MHKKNYNGYSSRLNIHLILHAKICNKCCINSGLVYHSRGPHSRRMKWVEVDVASDTEFVMPRSFHHTFGLHL